MLVSEMVEKSNLISDEDFEFDEVVSFFNDAISEINIECDANFPLLSRVNDENYSAFPDKWQISMLVPFAVGRTKQADSSQYEYNDAYAQFYTALAKFKKRYNIPEEYRDDTVITSYEPSYTGNPYTWE